MTDIEEKLLDMDIDVGEYDEMVNGDYEEGFQGRRVERQDVAGLIYRSGRTG
ncbi:hypothetical protein [Staphylococcus aureus]|uniref:hypothetical protein n=1 Tax=Staphylococcus aureus TaxID=1280 RepID=UPI0016424878|nr:hypothetical protein [Staphylococcus aureus]